MKVLIIGNTASAGWNLKKGLESKGHIAHLIAKENDVLTGKGDKELLKLEEYDIVHIHSPVFEDFSKYLKARKIVVHWHGTDLRGLDYKSYKQKRRTLKWLSPLLYIKYRITTELRKRKFLRIGDYHLYSTIDLAWWLRDIPNNKKEHIYCPIDTDAFKPIKCEKQGTFINMGGALAERKEKIRHDDMPKHLNRFEKAEVYYSDIYGISPYILSVTAMECLACGLKVKHHQDKDRDWIIKNCSIPVFTDRILKVYREVIKND